MTVRFLDTNILLRYLTGDDEGKAHRALALLERVERGEERVVTSAMVIFETIFTLQKRYTVPRERIRDVLGDIVSLRGIELSNKPVYLRALDIYVAKNISFADAFNAAYMEARGISEIYTWDTDFDKIEGIVRIDPTVSSNS